MRGKAQRPYKPHGARGITPAYAGKRLLERPLDTVGRDHPRLCGEKVLENADGEQLDRITPAYAGKSVATLYSLVKVQDHPRLCGEKERLVQLAAFSMGSPPPMRGKGQSIGYALDKARITPAYAGKRW